jgi:hypothetical protein
MTEELPEAFREGEAGLGPWSGEPVIVGAMFSR